MSFVALGVFIGTIGLSLGIDGSGLQKVAAVFLVVIGCVLTLPRLQAQVALAAAPLANGLTKTLEGFRRAASADNSASEFFSVLYGRLASVLRLAPFRF